jgi:flagellar hook-basal body complex protein FliE
MEKIMSETDISQVLTQMRIMAARAQGVQPAQVNETGQSEFSTVLKKSIDSVNETQKQAGQLTEAFQAGDPQVDLAQVMVALQKANVSFTAMKEVRNKLVSAYQEIMRMQV